MAFPAGGPTALHLGQCRSATEDCMDNKQEIVTISRPAKKTSVTRYKQLPLISERPHDFKQPDSSCFAGTAGAGQGNMIK